MPTPSSDPPLDPSSPPSYNFSTCPDEYQHSSRNTELAQEGMTPTLEPTVDRQDQSAADAPSAGSDLQQPHALLRGESLAADDHMSADLSSRASTVSSRPRSSATDITLPHPDLSSGVRHCELGSRAAVDGHSARGIFSSAGRLADQQEGDDSAIDSCDAEVQGSCFAGLDYSNKRSIPITPSSYLRPGTKFHGTQQSERQVYDVQVEIKYVDLRESFLCGYLRIQGLTEDHPTLTTYFEGEIIGTKYNFFTEHEDWGANHSIDLSHWGKFGAFRPYQKQAKKGPIYIPDVAQKETIFMRWKEHFLVPDHRVRTIHGASFEGFYYICFNQVKGEVSGIYFHSKSEKFQQLELKHVPDRGCSTAMEFR